MGELQGTPVFRDWKKAIKGGESLEDYKHRTQNWWTTSLLPCALSSFSEVGEQRNILVMSHGGFITTLVRELLASGQLECANDIVMGQCFNTAVAVIEVHGRKVEGEKLTIGKAVLVKYGDVSHLGTEEVRESNWDELAAKSL